MHACRSTLEDPTQDSPITRIYLTGLGSGRPHARQRIAEHYSVEVEDLPTLSAVSHSLPPSEADKVAASGAVAIGTALKVLGIDAGEIDLRRDEFRFARTFDAIKVALATGITFLFFGAFLITFTKGWFELKNLKRERLELQKLMEKELRVDVIEEYEKVVKDARHETESERLKSKDPDLYFQRMRTRLNDIKNHLKNELGLATEVPPIRSCLEPWLVVMQCAKTVRTAPVPKIPFMAITEQKYTQDKVDLKVVVGDLPDINLFTTELRKHIPEMFESVDTKQAKPIKEKGFEIPVVIVLKTKDSVEPPKPEPAEKEAGK